MTESGDVSIDEVRALVAERQRYDDWLSALDAKRAETPARVFERVHGDYSARRHDVMSRLREHIAPLSAAGEALDARLSALEGRLGTLEDERAEAMLRTAVGEYDSERWEQVRQDVEAQIAELGTQRAGLLAEVDEVRTLLASARSDSDAEAPADAAVDVNADADVEADVVAMASPEPVAASTSGAWPAEPSVSSPAMVDAGDALAVEPTIQPPQTVESPTPLSGATLDDTLFAMTSEAAVVGAADPAAPAAETVNTADEMADLDDALALFSSDAPADPYGQAAPTNVNPGVPSGLDGLDVFDDSELGDLRMAPPSSTATVTPTASPTATNGLSGTPMPTGSTSPDAFDDLAFLRSVVDSGAAAASRPAGAGDQQKTLRCTECGTMNLPTEWYCERCGGELAAF